MSPVVLFSTVSLLLVCYSAVTFGSSVLLNSNAIKMIPGVASSNHPVSAIPEEPTVDDGNQNLAIDTMQPLICMADEECGDEEFCLLSRGTCLQCKRRRKRCIRDAMCCPGNHCSNGVCLPNDHEMVQQGEVEEFNSLGMPNEENTTAALQPKVTSQSLPQNVKGLEGENCLRSSDCAEGLCCARHFWSKICKPVLKEGQVCTKHRRKGTHSLEIFQRCDCGVGLSCRTQRGDHGSKSSRSLHTCQKL
ncbi:dickkopf-related protein 1b [Chanos chanos]|uniref:Dickkopf-related protein 1b n=1 Tax=Chanos chanos TaxID=29144 RepID=A0A6J2VGA3_CHACN|nr:dickkopf-related protein 1 [Chanos chanos]